MILPWTILSVKYKTQPHLYTTVGSYYHELYWILTPGEKPSHCLTSTMVSCHFFDTFALLQWHSQRNFSQLISLALKLLRLCLDFSRPNNLRVVVAPAIDQSILLFQNQLHFSNYCHDLHLRLRRLQKESDWVALASICAHHPRVKSWSSFAVAATRLDQTPTELKWTSRYLS